MGLNLKKYEIILIIAILTFAVFLRFYTLGKPVMWTDESISALASKNIIEKGLPIMDSGALYGRAFVFHYLQTFFMLFGAGDFSARIISVLFGMATIILAYFIAKEYSKSSGIIALALFSVFFLEVFFSRQARMYQMFQFLFFFSIYLLYKISKTNKDNKNTKDLKNTKLVWLTILSLIILIDTHIMGIVLLPLLFIVLFNLKDKKTKILSFIVSIPFSLYFIYRAIFISKSDIFLAKLYLLKYANFLTGVTVAYLTFMSMGIIFAFKLNKRLTLFLLAPSVFLTIALAFVQLFATRYVYFAVFLILLFISVFLGKLHDRLGNFIIIAVILVLIVPSNFFYAVNYVTIIKPISRPYYDYTQPIVDYKSISSEISKLAENRTLITLWSAGAEWYVRKPDYVIPFSLTGLPKGYMIYNNTDFYTGAPIFDLEKQGVSDSVLLVDSFGLSKLENKRLDLLNSKISKCNLKLESYKLKVYDC